LENAQPELEKVQLLNLGEGIEFHVREQRVIELDPGWTAVLVMLELHKIFDFKIFHFRSLFPDGVRIML